MIEAAAKEMAGFGWAGIEVRAFNGSFHHKDPDGVISVDPPKPIKEWVVTFFAILKPGLTTIQAIGKGKTLSEAITKAKEKAHEHPTLGNSAFVGNPGSMGG